MLEFSHKPVMLEECMEGLALYNGGVWFDGTVGGGGHSYEILKRTAPNGRLIATDLDDEAIAAANKRLGEFNGRFTIYKSNYKNFEQVFEEAEISKTWILVHHIAGCAAFAGRFPAAVSHSQ